MVMTQFRAETRLTAEFTNRTTGQPASPGSAVGRIRYLSSPADLNLLQQGEILVIPNASTEWTPALNIAAGVIAKTGGSLCNLALQARESAIPLIVAAHDISRNVQSGDQIEINGSTGEITLLASRS